LRILKLPPKVQRLIQKGDLSLGHAKALTSLGESKQQIRLAEEIIRNSLSVRQAEKLALRLQLKKTKKSPKQIDPNLLAAENELQKALGTKVRIVKAKGAGRIEIRFYSDNELERLHKLLTQVSV
jgi:ParB family chromosome partitioning protein